MIPSATRIFVCTEPQDMRRSFDGLSLAAQEHLGEDRATSRGLTTDLRSS